MSVKDDARVVHVFVEDQSVVQVDDVCDWLRILDTVEEAKLQYDTARQTSFYWVRFKHVSAAQQAVNHLDGERLKNQVVHIRSNVYAKQQPPPPPDADAGEPAPSTAGGEQQQAENSNLPWNHRMPSDLRMDAALVNCIPTLLSSSGEGGEHEALVQQLRRAQESYCQVQGAIQQVEEEICRADKELVRLLEKTATPATAAAKSSSNHGENMHGVEVKRSPRIANTVQTP